MSDPRYFDRPQRARPWLMVAGPRLDGLQSFFDGRQWQREVLTREAFQDAIDWPHGVWLRVEHGGPIIGTAFRMEVRGGKLHTFFELADQARDWWDLVEDHPQASFGWNHREPTTRSHWGGVEVVTHHRAQIVECALMATGPGAYGDGCRVTDHENVLGWSLPYTPARGPGAPDPSPSFHDRDGGRLIEIL